MKKVPLIAPLQPIELSLQALVAARAEAIRTAAYRISCTARKAKNYLHLARRRHKQRGYEEGKEDARREFSKWCSELPGLYQDVATIAQRDSQHLATLLAEQLLELHITQIPESLNLWLSRATEILASSRSLRLLYHHRLGPVFSKLAPCIPPHIVLLENPEQNSPDFILQGDSGAVEFAWRSALDAITQTNQARG
jgi:hypothetical protein